MAINITSVECSGGFLPGITLHYTVDPMLPQSGNPFKSNDEVFILAADVLD